MTEIARKLLDKAGRAIHAAETLLREGDADFGAGRAYYAMFYTAEALLAEKGLRFLPFLKGRQPSLKSPCTRPLHVTVAGSSAGDSKSAPRFSCSY